MPPLDQDTTIPRWDDEPDPRHAEEAAGRLLRDRVFRQALACLIESRLRDDGLDCTVEAE
jgi:hypothetical protein